MRQLRAFLRRLTGLLPNPSAERDLSEEIESHLRLHTDDNLRAGMSPEEARRAAILRLGGVEPTKEAWRDRRSLPWAETLLQDLRFSLRQLRRNAGFTTTAVLMLSLGMCAAIAIFAFVDAALIKPLPYGDSTRLTGVYEHTEKCPACNLSYLDYIDWKKMNGVFRSLEAYQSNRFLLRTRTETLPTAGARVSAGFFGTLGIKPALGRSFSADEDAAGAKHNVLLSYAAWQNRFGGSKSVLGQTVVLDDAAYTVIGVLPRDFHFALLPPAEFWAAINPESPCEARRSCHNLYGVGRLGEGVSLAAAQAEMARIAHLLEQQYPGSNLGQGANVILLSEAITGKNRTILLALLIAAGLLLLIACVNIVSLLLVRSESRTRELAVRSALGASRTRLVRQFVTEGLILVAGGATLGLLSGYAAMRLLIGLIPANMLAGMPWLQDLGMNFRVPAFAALIALGAAIVFALTPALRLSLPDVRHGLAEGSRGSTGTTWRRLGSKLVVLELATAMVLLTGAGLLGKSLYRLLNVGIGLQPDHLATLQIAAPHAAYGKDEQAITLQHAVASRVAAIPGVLSVAFCSQLPISFNGNTDWIRFVGKPWYGEHNDVNQRDVSPRYFVTVKAKLLRGRYFREDDDRMKPSVIMINNALARMYFPGEDPVGRMVGNLDLTPKSLRQIIGVVEDIREGQLDEPMVPTEYFPFNQDPGNNFVLVASTSTEETSLLPALQAAIHGIDPAIVTANGASLSAVIHDAPSTWLRRSSAWLLAGFALAALFLGVVGLYGVVAYSVSQRTREIGVRMALGADNTRVCALVLREAGALAVIGIGAGIVCAIGAATLARNLLFGTAAWDVTTLAGVAVVLAIASLLASYIPARRAARVNPLDALRAE
jgi:macrolide transport system ATP-binding/permease protein